LKEMKRVSKGIVACREVDYESWFFYPHSVGMQAWKDCYRATCRHNKADPDAGRKLKSWYCQAGFQSELLATTSSTVTYADVARVKQISDTWAKRVGQTQLGDQVSQLTLLDI
jgi:hypothetical protein